MGLFDTPQSLRSKKLQEIKASGFKSDVKYKTPDCFLAIDDKSKTWFVLEEDNPKRCKVRPYSEIIDVEIIKNESVVMKSSSGSALGRGLVGAALFGGVGAIVGGSTASKSSTTEITKLGVRLILNDIKDPVIYINCIRAKDQVEAIYGSFLAIYKQNQ